MRRCASTIMWRRVEQRRTPMAKKLNLADLQANPDAFQQGICLATGSGPRRFGDVMAEFQRERFRSVNPSLLAVANHKPPPVPRVWDERTKGASKDTDWTINLLWLLAFSRR